MPTAAKLIALAAPLTAALALGCASTPNPTLQAATLAHPRAAEIWADKCGACHIPVEPGTRGRAALETALELHKKRATLSPDEWRELIDFLAGAPGRTAQNSGSQGGAGARSHNP